MSYTVDLTNNLTKSLDTIYKEAPTGPMLCVEIGAFEGRGSRMIAERLCKNPLSKLYCMDPLDDVYVKGDDRLAFWNGACKGQKGRFYENTKDYPNIVLLEGTSDTMIPVLEDNTVDFVYIDGDHSPEQVYKDAVNMLPKVKDNGVILFDDYQFVVNNVVTAQGIDKFLAEQGSKVQLLLKNWQLAVRVLRH